MMLSLSGAFVFNHGHTLMTLLQFHRFIPPVEGINALRLFLSQFLLPSFEVCFLHEKHKLASTQNPIKVYGTPMTGSRGA
jgi:hypothetical protein